MSSVFSQAIGAILNNYADVIEGGNTWRGSGTVYRGIPGTFPYDSDLYRGTSATLTVLGTETPTTTSFDIAHTNSWDQTRWVKNDIPGFYVRCTTSGGSTSIVDECRKITGWNNTTKVVTVAPAFSAAPVATDVFAVQQGFKRAPNNYDLESDDEGTAQGFDRFFSLHATAGEQLEWYGSGVMTFKTDLVLRVRFLKHKRAQDAIASAFENMMMIRVGLTSSANPDHRDGTYTRGLLSTGGQSQIVKEDQYKLVVEDKYQLIYRVSSTLK